MYIYESHMGGLYVSDDDLSFEEFVGAMYRY